MTDIDKLAREVADRTYREGPLTGPKARQLAARLGVLEGMKLQRERDAVMLDGWREWDWPEGVSRAAVAHVAEHFAAAIRSAL